MEKRAGRIIIQTPGGTAAKGSYTYKLSIPSSWIKEMGLSEDNRQVELFFDGLIDKNEAIRRLRYEKPNLQICFRTVEALQQLHFEGSEQI